MSINDQLNELKEYRENIRGTGDPQRIERQHKKGKLTARERIGILLDEDSLIELQPFVTSRSSDFGMDRKRIPGDGVITGSGKINGRQIFFSSQDFTVMGGSLGEMHASRIAEVQELAIQNGCPFIQINDSGGARIQEGILSLDGYGKIFRNNTVASGLIPQISVILGPCAGGAVYSPAITDFIFMVDSVSNMYITGPDVIKAVTGEIISNEELGGTAAHCGKSGVAHFSFTDEKSCLLFLREFLGYLPSNNVEQSPVTDMEEAGDRTTEALYEIVPGNDKQAYDIVDVIETVFDQNSFIEIQQDFAKNIVIGFARLAGRVVGITANQPKQYAAALTIDACDKAARFLRFCDAFNIPIITLVDVPGFLPGVQQEHGGIIRHGAKMLYAIAEATVPKVSLILRKAYGGAYITMSSKALGYDKVLAYPGSKVAVMGAEGAANIVFRKEIEQSEDPDSKRSAKITEYTERMMNPYRAAEYGLIDDVIDPRYTRSELIKSIEMHIRKRRSLPRKKHGNIPL